MPRHTVYACASRLLRSRWETLDYGHVVAPEVVDDQ